MDSNLIGTFRQTCAVHGGRPAVIDAAGALGFGELGAQVERLAGWLDAHGLRPGDTVAIALADERRHLLTSLALLRLGCPQVSLASHDPPAFRDELVAKCRVAAIVSEEETAGRAPLIRPDFDAAASPSYRAGRDLPLPDEETVALLLTGSGTTGRSKVVPQTHRSVLLQARTRKTPNDRGTEYILSSIEFLYPRKHRLRSAVTGHTSLFRKAELAEVPDICRRFGVDSLRLSPPQAQALIDIADTARLPEGLPVFVGGSRISGAMRAAFQRRQTRSLHVEYGATEVGNIAVAGPELHERLPDSVGRPLPGVALEVVDEADRPLPPGVEGLLRIRTPGMATRYLDDEALSARAFRDGWYYGGDRGLLNDEGIVVFGGRADDMMILNSINIFPAEIETLAETFPGVAECAAFPMRSPVHGDIPMLAVVRSGECDLGALMVFCRQRLGIRAPRKVVDLGALPRSAEGKVLRRELTARAAAGEFQ